MLYESNVTQKEEHIFRRWFQDDYFDLIVWYDSETRGIVGFQLCYDKDRNEHAFTWHEKDGFSHNKIDNNRVPGHHPVTPILVANGIFPYEMLLEKFKESSGNIDAVIS